MTPISPFEWQRENRPSVFATDPAFVGSKGKSRSQIQSEAIHRITEATGKNPGSIFGISSKSSAQVEEYRARGAKGTTVAADKVRG